jgi:hypothetical protein
MLSFQGEAGSFCDRVGRRQFLKIGALAAGGLGLPQLLRAESLSGGRATGKSIINIYLPGGPTHMDTFDLKPEAPVEFRGEFSPIPTNVPGVEICELMTDLATVADKYTIIRSTTGVRDEHSPNQSDSGWSESDLRSIGGRPGIGAVMGTVWGTSQKTAHGDAPTSIDLGNWSRRGFLNQAYAPYKPDGAGRENLKLNGVNLTRLGDRRALLSGLDRVRRDMDSTGMMSAVDDFTGRAIGLVTSGQVAKALDLRNEDPRNLARYVTGDRTDTDRFLLARRLIQVGVRCVAVSWGGWDTHGQNFTQMRSQLPPLSRALTALINDLEAHGMLDDTIVMMSGEFGRTPRVNSGAGRDHWAPASFFWIAGGGFRHGQVIGSTNRLGEVPKDRPVHIQHIFHTVYKQLGIDPDRVTLSDPNGRPQYLVDKREVIREMV